jgi:surface polysaccharide O-acyltransferase-like enzyme
MKKNQIKFNSLGHEPYFDFLKAFAILCVLIGHTFPYIDKIAYSLWAGMQVPFFVLIQAFHTLKKDSSKLKKLFYRIFIPYLIILGVIILVYLLTGRMNNQIAYKGLIGGGYGPGSYFPWIYIQLAIVLHFVQPLFKKWGTSFQTFLWLSICIGFELLESYICYLIKYTDY